MTRTPTTLSRFYDFLTDLDDECGRRSPWWMSTGITFLLAGAAVSWLTATDAEAWTPLGDLVPAGAHRVVTAVFNILVVMLYAVVLQSLVHAAFAPKHYHCDECRTCSEATGVPAVRHWLRARRLLLKAGWAVRGTNVHYCPKHATLITEG